MDYDRYDRIRALQWQGTALRLLDQRRLPMEEVFIDCHSAAAVAAAIANLSVRGAPAIGIAAAYGVVLAARQRTSADGCIDRAGLAADLRELAASRPTAVNLC